MKKYLMMGLVILIGTNIMVLAGVSYNRMGDAKAQLTLTERELLLPYRTSAQQENSGISLTINWRTPTHNNESYSPYQSKDITLSKDELLALGFQLINEHDNYWAESKELYWALEFDGALYQAEITKATEKYNSVLADFKEQPNDSNKRIEKRWRENLTKEKTSNSRLFFIEAAAHYQTLANKFTNQPNILIVKGLTKPFYNKNHQTYSLRLSQLSVSNIMVPFAYADVFYGLLRVNREDIPTPRYALTINWGNSLEPWVIDAQKLP